MKVKKEGGLYYLKTDLPLHCPHGVATGKLKNYEGAELVLGRFSKHWSYLSDNPHYEACIFEKGNELRGKNWVICEEFLVPRIGGNCFKPKPECLEWTEENLESSNES